MLSLLAAATRPLIIAGGGVIYSGATAELSDWPARRAFQ